MWSGKTTSMTTPVTCSTVPMLPLVLPLSAIRLLALLQVLAEALGARDDLEDLLGDLGLTHPVHLQGEIRDHLLRVVGRVPHRGHPRAVLRRGRLEQRPVDGE